MYWPYVFKTATVLPEDVEKIIKSCPNGKSPGEDCISYEHTS